MSAYDPNRRSIDLEPQSAMLDAGKGEAALRLAELHLTVAEFSELLIDMANGAVDIRVYSDAVVLMRDHHHRVDVGV